MSASHAEFELLPICGCFSCLFSHFKNVGSWCCCRLHLTKKSGRWSLLTQFQDLLQERYSEGNWGFRDSLGCKKFTDQEMWSYNSGNHNIYSVLLIIIHYLKFHLWNFWEVFLHAKCVLSRKIIVKGTSVIVIELCRKKR